jgi:hypothetical protein
MEMKSSAQLGTDQAVEADALLGGLHGQLPVDFGRDPDDEFPAIGPAGIA